MKKYTTIIVLFCLLSACSTGQKMLKDDLKNNKMVMVFFDYTKNELSTIDIAARKIQKRMEMPFMVDYHAKWFYYNNKVYLLYYTHLYEININAEEINEIYQTSTTYDNLDIVGDIVYLQKDVPYDDTDLLKYNMATHEEELVYIKDTRVNKFVVTSADTEILIEGSDRGSWGLLFSYNLETGLRSDIDFNAARLYSLAGDTVLYSVRNNNNNELKFNRELRTYNFITKERKRLPYEMENGAYNYYLFSEDKLILTQTHLQSLYVDILSDFINIRVDYYVANVDNKTKIKFYSSKNEIEIIGIINEAVPKL
jgi:uncharacterized protein YcfL